MKRVGIVFGILFLFIVLFVFISELVSPKYSIHLVEGGMIRDYYLENTHHDVLFLGDCEVYANLNPMNLYENYGITSYVRGTSQQLMWQSYFILKETLHYETPKVVVLNVNAMRYSEPVSEAYNRLTIDEMKWSKEKIEIIKASMTKEENFFSYLFPILRYHSRITSLTDEDFTYLFQKKKNTHNGFLINQNVKPYTSFPTERPLTQSDFSPIDYEYLDKIRVLCEENKITLVLMKAPSLYPYWYPEYEENIKRYANTYQLDYYNFLEKIEEIGIDYQKDTYDGGLHLNLTGANKLSTYFGAILKEKYSLQDHRNDDKIKEVYEKKLREYYKEVES